MDGLTQPSASNSWPRQWIEMANSPHQHQSQSQPDQGGQGWLVSTIQRQLVHFKPEPNSETTAWVSIRTYHYEPPRPPEPLGHRRVLHQNEIDTWSVMLQRGWRPCRAPARQSLSLLLLLVRQSMASIAQQCLASGCQSQITIDRLPLRNRFSCERQFGSARPSDQFHQRAWRLAIVELRR